MAVITATAAGCGHQIISSPKGARAPSITSPTDTSAAATTPPPPAAASTTPPPPVKPVTATARATSPSGDVAARAVAFMTAFANTRLGATVWWAGVKPLLTQQGGVAYKGTDPTLIPVHKVTGPATLLATQIENARSVRVPSDAGTYEVWLDRTGPAAPWLVERIVPPASQR